MGWYRRSGWYATWIDDCAFVQQLPLEWNALSSPSTFTARPFSTVTHTPHSILPQPRQAVRTRLTSVAVDVLSVAASAAGAVWDPIAAAAAATALAFRNVRRLMSSSLWRFFVSVPIVSSSFFPLLVSSCLARRWPAPAAARGLGECRCGPSRRGSDDAAAGGWRTIPRTWVNCGKVGSLCFAAAYG